MAFPTGAFLSYFTIGMVATIAWMERHRVGIVVAEYRSLTWRVLRRGALLGLATMSLAAIGIWVSPAFLLWGWPNLFGGRAGNVLLAPLNGAGSAPAAAFNVAQAAPAELKIAALLMLVVVILFVGLLLLVMPGIVHAEEKQFRARVIEPRKMVIRSFAFGLSHLLIGLPIVVGLVLAFPGYVLACTYRLAYQGARINEFDEDEAVTYATQASGRLHLAYNTSILVTLASAIALVLVLGILGLIV